MKKFRWVRLLLVLPGLLYVGLTPHWLEHFPVAGDEPHYLIIADSVLRDGDLRVVNNYEIEDRVHKIHSGLPDRHSLQYFYSVHNPGFALLVALPFGLGGIPAAKFFVATLMGLLPFLFFIAGRRADLSEHAALLSALVISLSMPWLIGAAQLFPDQVSGLLIFGLVLLLGYDLRGARAAGHAVAFQLGLAALPWIHLKQAAPAAVLLGLWAFDVLRQRPQGIRLLRVGLLALIPTAALIGLLLLNQHAFGSWRGPYAPHDMTRSFQRWFMILLGLHFDQTQGVFAQIPFFLLGLVGLPIMARRRPLFTCGLGLLYFSLILPNAMHTNWYGGYTFPGRFFWSSAPLWSFPVIALLERMSRRFTGALTSFSLVSLACQASYASFWIAAPPELLYTQHFAGVEHRQVFIACLRHVLPTYGAFNEYLKTWSTWAPLGIAGVLLGVGVYVSRRSEPRRWVTDTVRGTGAGR